MQEFHLGNCAVAFTESDIFTDCFHDDQCFQEINMLSRTAVPAVVLAAFISAAIANTYPEEWGFATSFRGQADPSPSWFVGFLLLLLSFH